MTQQLPIAVDAMGGDHGPKVVIEGAVEAAKEWGIASILVGKEEEIRANLSQLGAADHPLIHIRHAEQVVGMEESPARAVRGKNDSSLRVSFELVHSEEASAVVSPGNTGAMMATGLLVSGTLPGIARPAIASLIPNAGDSPPTVLLDSGANTGCNAQQLVQFALMGDFYARTAINSDSPRIGVLSNGTEASKGNDITRAASATLARIPDINFIGYVEGRDIAHDVADVVVCDGFVGNVLLKTMEGSVELVLDLFKQHIARTPRGKIGMSIIKPLMKAMFREKLDPSTYGGAPLLGLNDIAIVCHGSSKRRAIKNAIRVARQLVDDDLVERMAHVLSALDSELEGGYENGMWNRIGDKFDKQKLKEERRKGEQ